MLRLSAPVSLNQSHQDNNDGDDQQYVDETTHGVGGNQAEQPGNDQNQRNWVEHNMNSGGGLLFVNVRFHAPYPFAANACVVFILFICLASGLFLGSS